MPYKDPEKARERHAAYYAAHREERRAKQAAYGVANRERNAERQAAYRTAHPETVRERRAADRATHPEKFRERDRQWTKDNPGYRRAQSAKRRAMKISQRCTCCTDAEIQKVYDIAALCGPGAHVDHKIQLALGGHHCAKNLEAMTAEEHIEKSKLDAAARADSGRRNRLLHNWSRFGASVDTIQGKSL
jgi:hypothetical protein